MINATDTTLDIAPKRFNSVDMGNPMNILFGSMLHDLMSISKSFNTLVAREFICKDNCLILSGNPSSNHGQQCPGLDIGDYFGDGVTITFYHAHHNRLTRCTTATLSSPSTTNVCFINFNLPTERGNILSHEFANLFEHSPRCFVSDSKLTFKLLGRDTSSCSRHQKHGMKPRAERCIRLVEDSSRSRRYRVTTELTGVNLHAISLVMLGYSLATGAKHAVWISALEDSLKTSIIIRILLIELLHREFTSFHVSPLPTKHSTKSTVCQGIIAKY